MSPQDLKIIHQLLGYFEIHPEQIILDDTPTLLTISVEMPEADAGRLIGRFATTLDSLQLLLSLMLSRGETHRHVLLDVAGYRARRLSALTSLVERAKAETSATGAPSALPPLTSTERRQIHLLLQDDVEFTSYSDGEGYDRRLYVALRQS